jgi:hypothetical protein
MSTEVREKKAYQKPEVRRVELSLSEVTLGTGCFGVIGDPPDPINACYPTGGACVVP